jgi:hypothetical protein
MLFRAFNTGTNEAGSISFLKADYRLFKNHETYHHNTGITLQNRENLKIFRTSINYEL